MEGFETKDYSPDILNGAVDDALDENGELKKEIREKAKDILKTQLNRVYGIYGLIWSNSVFKHKRKALLEFERELGLNFEYYRRRVLTNNRLKRMHKPMTRRGER